MRHRAPRRLLAVLRRRPGRPVHRRLGALTARPTARVVGAAAAVLLLLTGGLAAATVLSDDPQTGAPAAGRLSAASPARDRPARSAPTPTLEGGRVDAPTRERPASTADRARPARPSRARPTGPTRPTQPRPTRSSLPTGDVRATEDVEEAPSGQTSDDPPAVTAPPPSDETAPQTTIVSGPTLREDRPLAFVASEPATFDCSLDDGPFRSCSSPTDYGDVGAGWHTVEVRATDRSGNLDTSPDTWRWHTDATQAG